MEQHFLELLTLAQRGVCIHVNGVPLYMKIDTGAEVAAISELEYRLTLQSVPKLQRTDRVLRGPDGKGLPVLGQFQAKTAIIRTTSDSSPACSEPHRFHASR